MDYRVLGRTGIKVSKLCFGTMSFGGDADEKTSAAMYKACRAAGINFFDSANVYTGGKSETILGKLIRGHRDEVVITTKVRFKVGPGINDEGLSRRHITRSVEASLKRLKTDRVELLFVHHVDADTPVEESLRALDDLVRAGKVLHPAVSNWSAWQIAKALGVSAARGFARFECLQPMYNLVKRQAEVEILPLAKSEQLGVIPYSPLGGGLLSGKYGVSRRPRQGRLIGNKMYDKRFNQPWFYDAAEKFTAYARRQGRHPATLAVAWVMSHPAVTAPIIGARNLEQLRPSLAAASLALTPEQRLAVSRLTPQPPPATDRLEEQVPA